ncbi:endonuclease V [Roseococcus sp. SYP-B2431]|uniref:deoxyribonuclease V n=1 Tax=Roseococcus sp. SYP-B2431 TaxID=2496640 RepID=UPI00103942CE|nr:deoxyribonuclease V [Roseococcus sp. SYP-B2431]TCH97249.1 endonuclease V [Roseococcus sp. SYP-B2431]
MADLASLREEQRVLAARVIAEDALSEPLRFIGGVDVSCSRFDPTLRVYAAIVVLEWPGLTEVDRAGFTATPDLHYITGLLGFREVPAAVQAFGALRVKPDLLMVDGQGIAHPRRLGIASHLGVKLDLPTIGVGKSRLVGTPVEPLGEAIGSEARLYDRGEEVGALLRTRERANPLWISIGHRISLPTALRWVRATTAGRRLPEPTRLAHEAAGMVRRAAGA